jgi:hypothetical protein
VREPYQIVVLIYGRAFTVQRHQNAPYLPNTPRIVLSLDQTKKQPRPTSEPPPTYSNTPHLQIYFAIVERRSEINVMFEERTEVHLIEEPSERSSAQCATPDSDWRKVSVPRLQ